MNMFEFENFKMFSMKFKTQIFSKNYAIMDKNAHFDNDFCIPINYLFYSFNIFHSPILFYNDILML